MNKIKIVFICLLIPFFIFIGFIFCKIKNKDDYQQKIILAKEIKKVLSVLMFDLREANESTILDAPSDGMWHERIAFGRAQQGLVEYFVRDGHLFRVNNAHEVLIADYIKYLRIRRQNETPDILEVQVDAHKNVSLISNMRVRIRH